MKWVKLLFGTWNRADFAVFGLILVPVSIFIGINYWNAQPITIHEIGSSAAVVMFGLLYIRTSKIARRTPPPNRAKFVVSMPLYEITSEFVYTGYKIEALTENTVVFVRFSIKYLFLFGPLMTLVWVPIILLKDSPESTAFAALTLSFLSFAVVYLFAIAGYGYDRIVFHQHTADGPSTSVTPVRSFLPSRVRAAVIATHDHGDEAWYKPDLDRL